MLAVDEGSNAGACLALMKEVVKVVCFDDRNLCWSDATLFYLTRCVDGGLPSAGYF